MTTKFLTIKFAKFPNLIVKEFPRKNSVFGQFSVNFPLPNPLQNANFINIVVSAFLTIFIAHQADSPESLESSIRANHATKVQGFTQFYRVFRAHALT